MSQVSSTFREALEPVLLALADDELIMGHRHSEWTGWAPHIEEDIAFSSIAQDEIGHANLFFTLLAEVGDKSADEIALGRQPDDYRNAIVCERPNRDWSYTLARHFVYEIAERLRLESLQDSGYQPLADVSEKLLREERYHQMHADAWFRRLAKGPLEGRHQFALSLSEVLPDTVGLFEAFESEAEALDLGILKVGSADLLQKWLTETVDRIEAAGVPLEITREDDSEFVATAAGEMIEHPHEKSERPPSISRAEGKWRLEGSFPGMGGRGGKHSPEFTELWEDLTRTYREEPTATW